MLVTSQSLHRTDERAQGCRNDLETMLDPGVSRSSAPAPSPVSRRYWPATGRSRHHRLFPGFAQFAYEEYGESTGSALPIPPSNRGLSTGEFAGGSPFKAAADEDRQQPVAEMRSRRLETAKAELARLGIDTPAEIEALSGDGVIGLGDHELRHAGLWPAGHHGRRLHTDARKLRTAALGNLPARIGRPGQGFAVTHRGDGPTRKLHRDGTLPNGAAVRRLQALRGRLPHELAASQTVSRSSRPIRSISRARPPLRVVPMREAACRGGSSLSTKPSRNHHRKIPWRPL